METYIVALLYRTPWTAVAGESVVNGRRMGAAGEAVGGSVEL